MENVVVHGMSLPREGQRILMDVPGQTPPLHSDSRYHNGSQLATQSSMNRSTAHRVNGQAPDTFTRQSTTQTSTRQATGPLNHSAFRPKGLTAVAGRGNSQAARSNHWDRPRGITDYRQHSPQPIHRYSFNPNYSERRVAEATAPHHPGVREENVHPASNRAVQHTRTGSGSRFAKPSINNQSTDRSEGSYLQVRPSAPHRYSDNQAPEPKNSEAWTLKDQEDPGRPTGEVYHRFGTSAQADPETRASNFRKQTDLYQRNPTQVENRKTATSMYGKIASDYIQEALADYERAEEERPARSVRKSRVPSSFHGAGYFRSGSRPQRSIAGGVDAPFFERMTVNALINAEPATTALEQNMAVMQEFLDRNRLSAHVEHVVLNIEDEVFMVYFRPPVSQVVKKSQVADDNSRLVRKFKLIDLLERDSEEIAQAVRRSDLTRPAADPVGQF